MSMTRKVVSKNMTQGTWGVLWWHQKYLVENQNYNLHLVSSGKVEQYWKTLGLLDIAWQALS